jgi:glyceraldehyde-3-phosphate dehydrogenase (NADP+)
LQGCVFTKDINKAILISDAMESGTIQINAAPARGPDHFPFQVCHLVLNQSSRLDLHPMDT